MKRLYDKNNDNIYENDIVIIEEQQAIARYEDSELVFESILDDTKWSFPYSVYTNLDMVELKTKERDYDTETLF